MERGGENGGEREEKILASLLNYWTVHSGSGSFAYSNIYTDSILPPVLLSPSGLPRQVGRKDGCAREDVSSRGSRGVNYFTILFEEARAWNLRNEIPRRLAETWLIFYRRPVYIYIRIYSYPIPPSTGLLLRASKISLSQLGRTLHRVMDK